MKLTNAVQEASPKLKIRDISQYLSTKNIHRELASSSILKIVSEPSNYSKPLSVSSSSISKNTKESSSRLFAICMFLYTLNFWQTYLYFGIGWYTSESFYPFWWKKGLALGNLNKQTDAYLTSKELKPWRERSKAPLSLGILWYLNPQNSSWFIDAPA